MSYVSINTFVQVVGEEEGVAVAVALAAGVAVEAH